MQYPKYFVRLIHPLLLLATLGDCQNGTTPTRYGVVLYPAFTAIDVFGPLNALNDLSYSCQINLSLISATLDPVTTKPQSAAMNPLNSSFSESVVPTHTFDNAPELDVLIIPGGVGALGPSPQLESLIAFVTEMFPTLKYLITTETTAWGPKVRWVAQARWVQDGNVFTSAGVSAGIDVTIAFIEAVYGNATATSIATGWST
ncbi:uncharacterized protein PAC_13316 [Phialocephala subalpina]|uniref:DJ-1/PfpI domain-containing protein n=1 Tax=Phialocephala subalpina TaxID=576137 RepID=A0A1L7XEE8_9HELO|nr:uncharacterized protein PAC_13316 [Phialocephala subalpina]